MIRVDDTSSWSRERIDRYGTAIIGAFERLAKRFKHDVTVGTLVSDAIEGRKRLWLVTDDDEFRAVAMTTVKTVEATGSKTAVLTDLAGGNVPAFADELCSTLETWARANDADFAAIEGRPGWDREMKRRGYRPYAIQWRKRLKD